MDGYDLYTGHMRQLEPMVYDDYTRNISNANISRTCGTFIPHRQALWRQYLPHATRLARLKLRGCVLEMSDLFYEIGSCLHMERRDQQARTYLEECVRMREEHLPSDYSNYLVSPPRLLANVYLVCGQLKEALKLLEHIASLEEGLPENDPGRLQTQHHLGVTYRSLGKLKEAIDVLEYVQKIRDEDLAENNRERLLTLHELGLAYLDFGSPEKVIQLLEDVVRWKSDLGENNPDVRG